MENCIVSTRAIVRNALARKAWNAATDSDVKVGDRVTAKSGANKGKVGVVTRCWYDGAVGSVYDIEYSPTNIDTAVPRMEIMKNAAIANAKFGITTKSGRSVVIEAASYKEAEREAVRRFGKGCIVDLVGNAVASNAKVGDIVEEIGKPGKKFRVVSAGTMTVGARPIEGGVTLFAPWSHWIDPKENATTFPNAATNAKFKVGDAVEVVGAGLAAKGRVGEIVKVDAKAKGWPYRVRFSDGMSEGEYAESELRKVANSITQGVTKGGLAKYHGKQYEVVSFVDNDHAVILKDPMSGETVRVHAFEVVANSRNAVVNAALAWKRAGR